LLYPQHLTAPPAARTHEWCCPAEIWVAPITPTTSTGTLELVFVPLPNCPKLFFPQHLTAPPATNAHEWAPPAETWVAPDRTGTGGVVVEVVVVVVVVVASGSVEVVVVGSTVEVVVVGATVEVVVVVLVVPGGTTGGAHATTASKHPQTTTANK
jgi:hypothetical protein